MPGFEVASLVLAVFPILVAGLNQMVAGIETVKRWKRYRLKLKDYALALESAHVYFFDTLSQLLYDVVSTDLQLEYLMAEPGGSWWTDIDYEDRVRERLDRSYNWYTQTIQALADNLKSLREKLGIDETGAIKWESYTIVEREMKRFKVTLSHGVYKEMPDEIRRANLGLRECTQQSIALEPTRRKRRSGRPVAELKIIRDHAASLYQVLMTDKAWICTCKAYHLASLRLEARPRTIDDVRANVPQPRGFRVLLSFADGKSHVGTMAQWDEVEIIASLDSCSRPLASGRPCPPTLTPDSDGSRTVGREDTDSAETTWKCIEDICSALCATNRGKREIGLLIDDTPNKQKHRLYRADTFIESQASSKSLEDLLRSRRELGDQGLSRKARLQIAVVLASSVLQLDGTSWLKRDWSSGDIFFHEGTNQLPAAGVGQSQASCRQTSLESRRPTDLTNGMGKYSYPYMSWQRCCQAAVPSQEPLQPPNHMVHSGSLLALGLTLVELCFGRNLMDLRKPQDMNGDETSMRLKTATRLHGLIYDEMGGSYGDVVRRCLFQPFDVREMSLDIEDVQQRVLENVVAPLMEELKNFDTEIRVGIL